MSSLMGLGFFQFDNLLKNRVPFVLLSYGVDFVGFDQGIFQKHLEKNLVLIEPKETFSYIETQKFVKEQSMVLVCTSGEVSQKFAKKLEASGYKNVFFVTGGYKTLIEEKNNNL